MGRSADEPPLVSEDVTCKREWVAGGRYLEDTTEGTAAGAPVWRKGWIGYNNMDQRYEWVTIDSLNSDMMIYVAADNSGIQMPIKMSAAFTDQGVSGEENAGKPVGMRTVITIENRNRHVFELYFTPPERQEVLATRQIYTRVHK
jgi:hypothetical protein